MTRFRQKIKKFSFEKFFELMWTMSYSLAFLIGFWGITGYFDKLFGLTTDYYPTIINLLLSFTYIFLGYLSLKKNLYAMILLVILSITDYRFEMSLRLTFPVVVFSLGSYFLHKISRRKDKE